MEGGCLGANLEDLRRENETEDDGAQTRNCLGGFPQKKLGLK